MPQIKIPFFSRFRGLFRVKLKPYLVDAKYKVIPAFSLGGKTYWMFDSSLEIPTGRFMAAQALYMEIEMGCDKQFLTHVTNAIEKILSPQKGGSINLNHIAQINKNLQERLEDLSPREIAIYKFASVIFFTKEESLYSYDYDYNLNVKIPFWKAAGGTLDFFSKTPLTELIPVLKLPEKDIQTYMKVKEMVHETHQQLLTSILSEE